MAESPYIRDSKGRVRQGATHRRGDERLVRIPRTAITFVRVDYQTRLQFDDTEVVIESPFLLKIGEDSYKLDPGERAGLGPGLSLYPDTLEDATVDDFATLHLQFASGASITIEQDDRYEAWQVNGPGTYLVVCMPGTTGELAIWS